MVHELRSQPRETEWLEFKVNNTDPHAIGEYISALANSAALVGKAFGYLIWGTHDLDHEIVGTEFDPHAARKGNEPLESWLWQQLGPEVEFHFFELVIEDRRVVILEIARAERHLVRLSGQAFIRIGSCKKKLKDFAEKERTLCAPSTCRGSRTGRGRARAGIRGAARARLPRVLRHAGETSASECRRHPGCPGR